MDRTYSMVSVDSEVRPLDSRYSPSVVRSSDEWTIKSNGIAARAVSASDAETSLLTSVDRCVRRHETGTMYGPDGIAYWSRLVVSTIGTVGSVALPAIDPDGVPKDGDKSLIPLISATMRSVPRCVQVCVDVSDVVGMMDCQ